MDTMRERITPQPRVVLSGLFSTDGSYLATDTDRGVRVIGLLDDDRDLTISMWRSEVRGAGFSPAGLIPTLLLVRRDRHGDSHLSVWTPGAGCRELGARFSGDVDAWWSAEGRILVRALGVGAGGMWVVDPSGAVIAA